MTSFLDCYDSITQHVKNLNLRPHSVEQQQDDFEQKFISLMNILREKIDHNKTFQLEKVNGKVYRITFLYDTLQPGLDILSKLEFHCQSYQISCTSTIMRNFLPLRIKQKQMRLSISRYLLRINGILKTGSIRLNPYNGQLTFFTSNFLSVSQFQSSIHQPMKLIPLLTQQLLKTRHSIRMHIYKILYLTNKIDQNYQKNPQLASYQIKSINSFSHQTMKLLDKILPFLHLEFPFMYNDHMYCEGKNVSPEGIRKMNETVRLLKFNSKLLNEGTSKCLAHLSHVKTEIKTSVSYAFSEQEKKDLINILQPPFLKHSTAQPPYVYSQIQVKTDKEIKWDTIDQGGFGMIRKAHLQFGYKKDMDKQHPRFIHPFLRPIVRKDDYQRTNKTKLSHQKDILVNLNHSVSPFIAKYYHSQQEGFSQSLMIQYCPQKSLATYRAKNKQFMTLNSKLIFLKYIAQGVKFLKDHNICHLDLKPSNILFGNGYVKLIDFGEAYHPQVCQKNFRPGTSLPYAPPESFSQDLINFSDRMDIFSLGVLMFEFLYDTYPMQHSKYHYNRMKQAYTQKTYQQLMQFAPQKCEYVVVVNRVQTDLQIPYLPHCSLSRQGRKKKTLHRVGYHCPTVLYQSGTASKLLVIIEIVSFCIFLLAILLQL